MKQRKRRWKEIETEIENKYLSTSGIILTCGDALTGEKFCVYKPDMMMIVLIDNRMTKHTQTREIWKEEEEGGRRRKKLWVINGGGLLGAQ